MFKQIIYNKKDFLDLLLLGDEQESMIDKYLEHGTMFALYDDNLLRGICVLTNEGNGLLELKNLAIVPIYQNMGYGKTIIYMIIDYYKDKFNTLIVGTGDSPMTLPFYEKCGFIQTHRIKNFFIDNYSYPIFEDGIQLIDMVYLSQKI